MKWISINQSTYELDFIGSEKEFLIEHPIWLVATTNSPFLSAFIQLVLWSRLLGEFVITSYQLTDGLIWSLSSHTESRPALDCPQFNGTNVKMMSACFHRIKHDSNHPQVNQKSFQLKNFNVKLNIDLNESEPLMCCVV